MDAIKFIRTFQSPQWGSNSKVLGAIYGSWSYMFQSPQWGSNSKVEKYSQEFKDAGFSPRNGEVILKCK